MYLLDAQRDIKRLAERINKGRHSAEEAEREARVIQEIEAHIEGVEHVRYSSLYLCNICASEYDVVITLLFMCVLDPEPTEEVLKTGNGHGGGKTYLLS